MGCRLSTICVIYSTADKDFICDHLKLAGNTAALDDEIPYPPPCDLLQVRWSGNYGDYAHMKSLFIIYVLQL